MKKKNSIAGIFLVLAFCIVISLLHFKSTLEPVVYPRFTAIAISIFILTAIIWFERRKHQYNLKFLKNIIFGGFLLFIILSLISLFFATNPVEGLTDIFKWILVLMLIILVTLILNASDKTVEWLYKGVLINAFIASLIGIYQYFTLAFQNPDPNALYEVKGLMAHKNQFSISLFLLLPFILNTLVVFTKVWKKMAIVALSLVIINILLLQTRAVWMAIFFAGLISGVILLLLNKRFQFFKFQNRRLKKIVIIVVVLMGLGILTGLILPVNNPVKLASKRVSTVFNPDFTSNQWRIEIWDATIELAKDNPVIGVGAGNWKINIYPYYSEHLPSVFRHWRNPHNDYLSILSEKGYLSLIIYLLTFLILIYYLIILIYKSEQKNKSISLILWLFGIVGYMIISFFSFPNDRPNHWIFLSLIVAIIISEYSKLKDIDRIERPSIKIGFLIIPFLILSYLATHFGFICINSELNISKAITAKEKNEWKQVRKYATKAYHPLAPIEPTSSFPISLYQGLAEFNLNNLPEALIYFKEAYSQHPTSISVINNIGSVYGQMGQLDSSIVYYKKSLDIFPHYEISLLNLMRAYYINKDFENAYQVVLSCDPKSENNQVRSALEAIEKELDQ